MKDWKWEQAFEAWVCGDLTPHQKLSVWGWGCLMAAGLALLIWPGVDVGSALICATLAFVARIVLEELS